ncbi:MAG: hypothetical protein ACE5E1_08540 [Phycisphaerae bacterium]
MVKRSRLAAVALLGAAWGATGCAPATFHEGVPWAVQRWRTTDAKTQTVRGMPFLRVNSFLLGELDRAVAADERSAGRPNLVNVVDQCHGLAVRSARGEIDRLPPAAIEELWTAYFPGDARPGDLRAAVRKRYLAAVEKGWRGFRARLAATESPSARRRIADDIRRRVNPSIKAHHGHGLFLAVMMEKIPASEEPLDRGGPEVDLYEPDPEALGAFTASDAGPEAALLARFAPIILQERRTDALYAADSDRIGTVRLEGTPERIHVVVDTDSPSVYAYWQRTIIHGRPHLQLVYCHWFPRRPALKPNDPEAGPIDGATLRITLDRDQRPAVFETILNCGCYHRCYVSVALETAAEQAHGPPLPGKRTSAARKMTGTPDWVVPETVKLSSLTEVRPILFSRAGYHGLAGVSFDAAELTRRRVLDRRRYVLRLYDVLENLPTPYGRGSMFGADGLVHYAGRPEGWLLAGTGMVSAGQPRQRGTQRICWDQYDFDDPHLIEKCLRLPPDF